MIYTKHALKRFTERYPHLNLVVEEKTFKPASKRLMKQLAKTLPGKCTPVSNKVGNGGKIYVSKGGAVAAVMINEGKKIVTTFLKNPRDMHIHKFK